MFKIVISNKDGKAYQIERDVPTFIGMRIGQNFDGSLIGMNGYILQVTGGSDKEGFPMRRDLDGMIRKKALLTSGPGYRPKGRGVRERKMIRGNRIGEDIVQVNVRVVEKKSGAKSIEEILGIKKEEGAVSEEKKTEEKKEPVKKEEQKPKKEDEKKVEEKDNSKKEAKSGKSAPEKK
ncbi:MAG: 30S ribosomal protein S6e [Candidatus Aenigmarchaeota archaeon]|nr:30S ribosomal protein S6e [Candidatus Aenigmarchaeota archaeon]